MKKEVIVIDINFLPMEYKTKYFEEVKKEFDGKLLEYNVLYIDSSKQNSNNGCEMRNPPIYKL